MENRDETIKKRQNAWVMNKLLQLRSKNIGSGTRTLYEEALVFLAEVAASLDTMTTDEDQQKGLLFQVCDAFDKVCAAVERVMVYGIQCMRCCRTHFVPGRACRDAG